MRDRFLVLRSLPTIAGIDEEGLFLLAENTRYRRFRAREEVLQEGAPIRAVHIVVEGRILESMGGHHLHTAGRSEGVGFIPLMARAPDGVSAIAEVETTTLELPTDVLFDVMEENFSVVRNALCITANNLLALRDNLPAHADHAPTAEVGRYRERPRTLMEIIIETRKGPLFQNANLDAVTDLSRRVREVRFNEGDTLWKIGDSPNFSVRIEYGLVCCQSDSGDEVTVGRDYVLGSMDSLGDRPRAYHARATTPVIAYRIDRDDFLAMLETHYQVALDLLAILATELLTITQALNP